MRCCFQQGHRNSREGKIMTSYVDAMRQAVLSLTVAGDKAALRTDVRKLLAGATRAARQGSLAAGINDIASATRFEREESTTWLDADAIRDGRSGAFDACDLEMWLAICARLGVAAVPGKVILRLNAVETELVSGESDMPAGPSRELVLQTLHELVGKAEVEGATPDLCDLLTSLFDTAERDAVDREDLQERLAACMDDVPEGWMVRTAACGGSELKALAGTGLAGPTAPETRFGPGLEVGPGWVRLGNRRMVNTRDHRTLSLTAERPKTDMVFIARPWVQASRWIETMDPHRDGSPFAGPGRWPAEWRAFVVDGKVTGVAFYYAFSGEMTPENARMAIQVRDVAQRLVDGMTAQKLWPRFMKTELARRNPAPEMQAALEGFGREAVSCSLDFIETDDGLLLLEGGPPNLPFGGAHVCAFAGNGLKKGRFDGRQMARSTYGVAFRTMPHINMMEPSTWYDGDHRGSISTWAEVEELALQDEEQVGDGNPPKRGLVARLFGCRS
ncbi:hypothetical protein [Sphingomonas sp. 3-13AW]|uniref:hypothetical protein n=1 Tax=Sphingomonas sp. 3-13AW TaxID=3050450 RepID=UPI003BB4F0F3